MKKLNVFRQVATHLLKQNKKSSADFTNGSICFYKHGDLRCAIGCLIKDEHYNEALESNDGDDPRVIKAVEDSLGQKIFADDRDFLRHLQSIHDTVTTSNWGDNLDAFAKNHFQRGLSQLNIASKGSEGSWVLD